MPMPSTVVMSVGLTEVGLDAGFGVVPLPASGSPEKRRAVARSVGDHVELDADVWRLAASRTLARGLADTVPTPIADSETAARITVMRSLLRNLVIGVAAPSYTETRTEKPLPRSEDAGWPCK